MEKLGSDPKLLSAVGSQGDTLADEKVLAAAAAIWDLGFTRMARRPFGAYVGTGARVNEEREDFMLKLMLIEHEANSLLKDLRPGLMWDRAQNIAVTAKLLKKRDWT